MNVIYGIDTTQPLTPLLVRDAITECFYEAHCDDSDLGGTTKQSREYCLSVVKKGFEDSGVEFENPTKEGLGKVVQTMAAFSSHFRSPEIIAKHIQQIKPLIELLP